MYIRSRQIDEIYRSQAQNNSWIYTCEHDRACNRKYSLCTISKNLDHE